LLSDGERRDHVSAGPASRQNGPHAVTINRNTPFERDEKLTLWLHAACATHETWESLSSYVQVFSQKSMACRSLHR
jgi:hypothetical protein